MSIKEETGKTEPTSYIKMSEQEIGDLKRPTTTTATAKAKVVDIFSGRSLDNMAQAQHLKGTVDLPARTSLEETTRMIQMGFKPPAAAPSAGPKEEYQPPYHGPFNGPTPPMG